MVRSIQEDYLIIPTLVRNHGEYYNEFLAVPIEELGRSGLQRPKIVVRCLKVFQKVCVIGSIVYLFSKDTAVGTFDLSFFLSSSEEDREVVVVLRDDMIRYISPMKHEKRDVEALPTPGRKILAFSISISKGSCFELYDPDTDIWEDVPGIEQHLKPSFAFQEINSYFFIDNYTFVIQNRSGYPYLLFLGEPTNNSRWHDDGWLGGGFPFCGFPRAILGGGFELCLSDNSVWDVKNEFEVHKAVSTFPLSAFHPSFKSKSRMTITGGRWSQCCVLEIATHSGECYLTIEVYHLELAEYFEKKNALEEEYYFKRVDRDSSKHEMPVDWMNITSLELEWKFLHSSRFLLGPRSSSHRLDTATTFSV